MTDGSNGQLKSIVERVERLREEVKGLNDDVSDVYKEAKSNGFDPKIIKKIVADRAKDPGKLSEEQELYALYWEATGGRP